MKMDADVWAAVTSLTTGGLLIVTAAYAWLTYRMTKATERQSWESSRPRMLVCVRAGESGQLLILHVENVGVGPAYDLHLSIDRVVHVSFGGDRAINNAPLFARGLRCMPPCTPSRFGIGVAFRYLDPKQDRQKYPTSFTVTATYRHRNREITDSFPIDLEEQYSLSLAEHSSIDKFSRDFPAVFKSGISDIVSAIDHTAGK